MTWQRREPSQSVTMVPAELSRNVNAPTPVFHMIRKAALHIESLVNNSDVIMSSVASKSQVPLLFTQSFMQAQIKENTKAPRHWTLWAEFTGELPTQRASNAEKVSIWRRHHIESYPRHKPLQHPRHVHSYALPMGRGCTHPALARIHCIPCYLTRSVLHLDRRRHASWLHHRKILTDDRPLERHQFPTWNNDYKYLTHCGRDKMATLSKAFGWMRMIELW